jgi:hypothetical protein
MGRVNRLRVIVLGYIVRGPVGGLAWHHLQYVMGLAGLGHDVFFLEDSDEYPSCYDPVRFITTTDPSYGLRFTADAFDRTGLGNRWAYFDAHTSRWVGPCADRILDVCATADVVLNVSGMNPLRPWLMDIPVRVLIDTDPVFTQIRHLTDTTSRERAAQHTAFFSFGENIGTGASTVPDDGFPWKPTRQPIVLGAWPASPGPAGGSFTTVMLWDSYRPRTYAGRTYGMKSASFEPFLDLPARASVRMEAVVGSPTAPKALLRDHGWVLRDPLDAARDPWAYRSFIQRSRAEFSIAKHGYVVSGSGWFSERSAGYLASARPVVLQDTGYSKWLPTGAGILPFSAPDEALTAMEEVTRRYSFHCDAARAIAEDYFESGKVLSRLIDASDATGTAATTRIATEAS